MMSEGNRYFDDETPELAPEQEQAIRRANDALSEITPEMESARAFESDAFAKMEHYYPGDDEVPPRVFIDHDLEIGPKATNPMKDTSLDELFSTRIRRHNRGDSQQPKNST